MSIDHRRSYGSLTVFGLLLTLSSGCALLRKGEPLQVRYFSASATPDAKATPDAVQTEIPLRLGRVAAASHIGERIVYRKDQVEVGYYDSLRWTEPPEHYLQRMLAAMLFEKGKFTRVISGPGPTLEATLLTFEEQRGTPHLARATVAVSLYDERMSRVEQTFNVDVELPDDGESPTRLANALSTAMARVAQAIVTRTESALAENKPLASAQ